ncbi:MAG TPA: glycosyltransferase family 4 protein [Xanthobacteraceae bacterium]|nr:glycosyltransferase family 4 protein [Xanthobacteraceae bacterium]
MALPVRFDPALIEVLHPNLHRRYSGVTTTILTLAPAMSRLCRVAIVGAGEAPGVPTLSLRQVRRFGRSLPAGRPFRIWHARRNDEMIAGLLLKHIFGLKLGMVFTSAAQRHHTAFSKFLMRRMDALISPSPEAASYLTLPVTVALHGVDIARYRPAPDRAAAWKETGLPGCYGIGVFGRIRPQKGTDLFIEAMLKLLPRYPDFTAVVIGLATEMDKGFEAELKSKVAAAGLAGRIVFTGELPPDEVPLWFRRLLIFVGPQRNEGFGLTTLEAMASEMAVVATRAGAAAHLVAEGETGFLVPIEDAGALTDRIEQLMQDPARAEAMGKAGRKRVEAHFNIEREAKEIFAVYERLWASARSTAAKTV